jgi:hypothetical protein
MTSESVWLQSGAHRHRRVLLGGEWCGIDAAIADTIVQLNRRGLTTVACCQGDIRVGSREALSIGYVKFVRRPKGFSLIAAVAEKAEMMVDRNAIHAHPAMCSNGKRVWQDKERQARANRLFRRFLHDLGHGELDTSASRYMLAMNAYGA